MHIHYLSTHIHIIIILLTFFLKPDVPGFIPSIGAVEIVTISSAVSVLLIAIDEEDIVLLSPPREENMVS